MQGTHQLYAVLGATGNCGLALMQLLLAQKGVKINAYCRNQAKLYRLLPEVENNKRVDIYEGSIEDEELLATCTRNCKAAFLVASTNDNVPGCHISQDLILSIIGAFRRLKNAQDQLDNESSVALPKLCLLSSSTLDDHLSRYMGTFFRYILSRSAFHVYEDLRLGEMILRQQEHWITAIYMKPGGISVDVQRGHELSLDQDQTFISYLDVAAGMIEACDDPNGHWDLKNVSVRNVAGAHQSEEFRAKRLEPPGDYIFELYHGEAHRQAHRSSTSGVRRDVYY
ncbi:NAD-dependent epimerase [Grosmannia clavigera kw1407]|uniref:NAD-dependent epimerase n=1 Tax=Grosmannia clavigera (strain kw1407 / UAMH 11150) TaxID=655863 RepID=F0XMV6_GROCL|nr:NAD-dependent epimerase [Grosmannia clavigera kw1407]EFX00935.1 NAD-dependent epimerase [Grosmannia clavigera kw1407]